MRRLAFAPLIAAFALVASGAQAAAVSVPSAQVPNASGAVVLTFGLSTPPAVPETRSYAQLLRLWKEAGAAYGVPWEVLGAINKIESDFGRNMGPSSAGAVGWMQFMPSTWERWGWDFDGDGAANPWDPDDAVYAAARYLAAAGAADDLERAIFAYNHADWYVRDVLELANVFAGGGGFDPSLGSSPGLGFSGDTGPDAVFRLDSIEKRLSNAREAVNRAQRQVTKAERRVSELDAAVLEAEARAGDPDLSDEEFQRVEAEVTQLVLAQERAVARVARKRKALDDAAELADDLRAAADEQASTFTFTRTATSGLGAPEFAGQYVFPVGGGASVVSVSADHHDYPAADIAAPEGSPLYALSDGVVLDVYTSPGGRCGIGFSMQLADGSTYLYCHLSYIEPSLASGTTLAPGTPVGLVGATGHATGPHLHLQHVPVEDGYPQREAWFEAFAGTAFSWQGDPPQGAPASLQPPADGPVITFNR